MLNAASHSTQREEVTITPVPPSSIHYNHPLDFVNSRKMCVPYLSPLLESN
jgi:hypothetical protein